MLKNISPLTAKGSYLTVGNYGASDELRIGGPITIGNEPDAAETSSVDMLDDPSFQDAGAASPGSFPMSMVVDPNSEDYEMLYDAFIAGSPMNFNWYVSKERNVYDATATGLTLAKCAIAAVSGELQATFTAGVPPWGTATAKGQMGRGNVIQFGSGNSAEMYRISKPVGASPDYTQSMKLVVTAARNIDNNNALAGNSQTAGDYRIFVPRRVFANWSGRVIMAQSIQTDIGNTVVQGNVTIAPEAILPKPNYIPWA